MKYHQPVLLKESLEGLNLKSEGVYVDATFGGGGHSREILKHLNRGKLIAFDQDESVLNHLPEDPRFIFVHHNFRFLKNFLRYHGHTQIDGLIADLGVSSHHFDTPGRGFSFRFDSGLDMRMNVKSEFSAKELINSYTVDQLTQIFKNYGELPNARSIAQRIENHRSISPIKTSNDLIQILSDCLPKKKENQFLAKVFQALRIEVNKEIEYLKELLLQTTDVLKDQGRIVIISYHSLEDRIVKNFFRYGKFESGMETDLFGNKLRPLVPVYSRAITPSEEEISENNRARSARLRIAEKSDIS